MAVIDDTTTRVPAAAADSSPMLLTNMQEGDAAPHGCGVAVVDDATTVYLLLTGILDASKEIEKLGKKQAEAQGKVGLFTPVHVIFGSN